MLVTIRSSQLGQEEDVLGRAHELVLFMVNLRPLWDLQKGDLGSGADQLFTLGNFLCAWCPHLQNGDNNSTSFMKLRVMIK